MDIKTITSFLGFALVLLQLLCCADISSAQELYSTRTIGEFTGTTSEKAIDSDGDGFFEEIEVSFEIAAAADAEIFISGELRADGKPLPNLPEEFYQSSPLKTAHRLKAGETSRLSYRFPAALIHAAKADGPYQADIIISTPLSIGPLPLKTTITTRKYLHTEFQMSKIQLSIGEVDAFDFEEDGQDDALFAKAKVKAELDGEFVVWGRLLGASTDGNAVEARSANDLREVISLKESQVEDITLFFSKPWISYPEHNFYKFDKLEIIVLQMLDSASPARKVFSVPVQLSSNFPAKDRQFLFQNREIKAESLKVRGINSDKDEYFEAWLFKLKIGGLAPGAHRIELQLNTKEDSIYSGEHFCVPEGGLCELSATISTEPFIKGQNRDMTVAISGTVYFFDKEKF